MGPIMKWEPHMWLLNEVFCTQHGDSTTCIAFPCDHTLTWGEHIRHKGSWVSSSTLPSSLCFQTHQPVFIQLLQSAFRIYNCTWPNPAQKACVESCIRTLAEVGESLCQIFLIFTSLEQSGILPSGFQLMKTAGVSVRLGGSDQQVILNTTSFVGGKCNDISNLDAMLFPLAFEYGCRSTYRNGFGSLLSLISL